QVGDAPRDDELACRGIDALRPACQQFPRDEVRVTLGAAARIERLDDRTVRLDDRFTVRGSGTERDPYLITWELLASGSESVDAAAGRCSSRPIC
ncbi:MAG: hypothetical protein ACKOHI_09160, partial [Phycisphaerales bacterium]